MARNKVIQDSRNSRCNIKSRRRTMASSAAVSRFVQSCNAIWLLLDGWIWAEKALDIKEIPNGHMSWLFSVSWLPEEIKWQSKSILSTIHEELECYFALAISWLTQHIHGTASAEARQPRGLSLLFLPRPWTLLCHEGYFSSLQGNAKYRVVGYRHSPPSHFDFSCGAKCNSSKWFSSTGSS